MGGLERAAHQRYPHRTSSRRTIRLIGPERLGFAAGNLKRRQKENMKKFAISAALALAAAATASATVTFDPVKGTGFVGKGDVQTVLGLNNAAMQTLITQDQAARAQGQSPLLTFTYVTKDTYEVVNAWATGNPNNPVSLNYHQITVTTTVNVKSDIAYDPRKQNQYKGYKLLGNGLKVSDVAIPVVSPLIPGGVTYSWTTRHWDGTYDTVPNPKYDPTKPINGNNTPNIDVKHFVETTHYTDQRPAYEDEFHNKVLYSEGDNKAILSVTKLDSVGELKVNGYRLPLTPTLP